MTSLNDTLQMDLAYCNKNMTSLNDTLQMDLAYCNNNMTSLLESRASLNYYSNSYFLASQCLLGSVAAAAAYATSRFFAGKVIADKDQVIADKDQVIADKYELIADKDQVIVDLNKKLKEKMEEVRNVLEHGEITPQDIAMVRESRSKASKGSSKRRNFVTKDKK
jgi:hypothetical protein